MQQRLVEQIISVLVVVCISACISMQAQASQLSTNEWRQLQQNNFQAKSIHHFTETELSQLFKFGTPRIGQSTSIVALQANNESEQTYITAKLLNKLGTEMSPLANSIRAIGVADAELSAKNSRVNANLMQWVNSLRLSEASIRIPNIDHPQQTIEVVNIRRLANSTLRHWRIKQHLHAYQTATAYSPELDSWIFSEDKLARQALVLWIKSIDQSEVDVLTNKLLTLLAEQPELVIQSMDPSIWMAAAIRSKNIHLYEAMWLMPIGEFSYQLVQAIPNHLPVEQAIQQLQKAASVSQLQSQAMLLLAKHYLNHIDAQLFLFEALKQDDMFWPVFMALKQSGSEEIWKEVGVQVESLSRTLSPKLQKALRREIQQQGVGL